MYLLRGMLLFMFAFNSCEAQYKEVMRFDMHNGLPSNHLYNCLEDHQGFLWIATDAGLARFDGRSFQVFTTEHGLPDNDVIQVVIERSGRIWANCFNGEPAYFNETENRFINSKTDTELKKMGGNGLCLLAGLPEGGMISSKLTANMFSQGLYVLNRLYALPEYDGYSGSMIIKLFSDGSMLSNLGEINSRNTLNIRHCSGSRILDSSHRRFQTGEIYKWNVDYKHEIMYSTSSSKPVLFRVSDFKRNPVSYKVEKFPLVSVAIYSNFCRQYYFVTNTSKSIDVYDRKSMKFKFNLKGNYIANALYIDRHQNAWVTTIDKGIVLYRKQGIRELPLPQKYTDESFLSIDKSLEGNYLLGSYSGEVMALDKNGSSLPRSEHYGNRTNWIRGVQWMQDKLYILSEQGIFSRRQNQIGQVRLPKDDRPISAIKSSLGLNDTTLIIGTMHSLFSLNTTSDQTTLLQAGTLRVTSLASVDKKDIIYIGSSDGLHTYSHSKNSMLAIHDSSSMLRERIAALCTTPDSLLWIATAGNGIGVVYKDKIVGRYTIENGLSANHSITIASGRKGQVWVGTNKGVSIINYTFNGALSLNGVQNIRLEDGLTSNVINQMCFRDDTMYAATNRGISVIPASISISSVDIPIVLTGVQLNHQPARLLTSYKLNPNQNYLSFQFAGVELTGHFKSAEYSLDQGRHWNLIDGNTLALQLSSGDYALWLRAVDVNGNKGSKILKLDIFIDTFFYKTWWFIILITMVVTATIVGLYSYRKRQQQQLRYKQQLALEIQRNKITADLHDDIGSTLSSLQLNSNLASRLVEMKNEKALDILKKIEWQSKSLAEKLGDFIWSLKSQKDEFMSLSNRIRMFGSDILGSLDIDYTLDIDEAIDTMSIDASYRKGILLICKEAINNAAKYSEATRIALSVKVMDTDIRIALIDNGKGMQLVTQQYRGNGLLNMKKRAEELHGIFSIQSSPGEGTQIQVSLPIPSIRDSRLDTE